MGKDCEMIPLSLLSILSSIHETHTTQHTEPVSVDTRLQCTTVLPLTHTASDSSHECSASLASKSDPASLSLCLITLSCVDQLCFLFRLFLSFLAHPLQHKRSNQGSAIVPLLAPASLSLSCAGSTSERTHCGSLSLSLSTAATAAAVLSPSTVSLSHTHLYPCLLCLSPVFSHFLFARQTRQTRWRRKEYM